MPVLRLANLEQFAAVNLNSDPGRIAGPKIIPNAAMVRINWNMADGKTAHNILYATYSGTPALSTSLAQSIYAAISTGASWTALNAFLSPTGAIAGVTVLDVRTNTGIEFTSTGPAVAGASTGTAMPDEVAAVITLRTGTRGPGGRGRYYVPNWASNANAAGNVLAAGVVTALNNWGFLVFTTIGAQIGSQVLGLPARAAYTSPVTGRIFPARPAGTLLVTQVVCRDNHWDSQRRRGLK